MEFLQSLWKPGLVGLIVLVIGAIAGWGMAGTPNFVLTRVMRWWVLKVIVPLLKQPFWLMRAAAIFVNNSLTCVALVACGGVPAGAWIAITTVALAMGAALRVLVTEFEIDVSDRSAPDDDVNGADGYDGQGVGGKSVEGIEKRNDPIQPGLTFSDPWMRVGLFLNLLEFPAIGLTLALSMMQHAVPITHSSGSQWPLAGLAILPLLAVAACGESLWMRRQQIFGD
jgi:hypothetical protein